MKICCILYHSNILKLYKKEWVQKCINTITNQTFQDFDVFELNYGEDNYSLENFFDLKNGYHFLNQKQKMDNHAEAMNYLLDMIFKEKEYDFCFNINLDDYYDLNRFEKQIEIMKQGFDISSSEYIFIKEVNGEDKLLGLAGLSTKPLGQLFQDDITPIAHPCVCYSKSFWINYGPYIPSEIPREDKNLWIRSYSSGAKLYIIKEPLLYYRLHDKQVSKDA
jgi:hypothetical protein